MDWKYMKYIVGNWSRALIMWSVLKVTWTTYLVKAATKWSLQPVSLLLLLSSSMFWLLLLFLIIINWFYIQLNLSGSLSNPVVLKLWYVYRCLDFVSLLWYLGKSVLVFFLYLVVKYKCVLWYYLNWHHWLLNVYREMYHYIPFLVVFTLLSLNMWGNLQISISILPQQWLCCSFIILHRIIYI